MVVMRRHLYIFFFICYSSFCQYSISGYINSDHRTRVVYLSLLEFDESESISPNQVLLSTKTDSTGFFIFTGKILSKKSKYYRIHTNSSQTNTGLELYHSKEGRNNYYNFIFSNSDTIFFPNSNKGWFINSNNTNRDDAELRRLIEYKSILSQEYRDIKNLKTLTQTKRSLYNELKQFSRDSISSSLVNLLFFSYFREETDILTEDYEKDPDFYEKLLDDLNREYSDSSYNSQFKEELSKLSFSLTNQKYLLHKKINYISGILIVFLVSVIIFMFFKSSEIKKKMLIDEISTLTIQEEKIASLIAKGLSNKDIASQLFISLSTVKTHISNLYSKLNVLNRKQLINKIKNSTKD